MSTDRRQLIRNASLTALQVIVTSLSMFIVYRYLLTTLGASRLGTWSIVMAASSLARVTDLGFAGGLTRYVAQYKAINDEKALRELIETGTISLLVLAIALFAAAYPLLHLALPQIIPQGALDAILLLPYSLASLGTLTLAGVFLSSLDGVLRTDLRNIIMICSVLLYMLLAIVLVERWGFVGLGWAQLAQSIFVLISAWVTLRSQILLPLLPWRWTRERFSEMIAYNIHLQIGSLSSLLGDPVAKILLGRYGDLSTVGYFEMATKLVSQFRAVVVNVNQLLVPVIARLKNDDTMSVHALYEKTHRLLFLISVTFFGALLAVVPTISELWLGKLNHTFSMVCMVMLPAMAINTMAGAAFFSNLGTGDASSNSSVQLAMGIINLCLGWVMGSALGGTGVILAYGLSIVIGSAFLMMRFHRSNGISYSSLLPQTLTSHLIATLVIGIFCNVVTPYAEKLLPNLHFGLALLAITSILFSAARREPARTALQHFRHRIVGSKL